MAEDPIDRELVAGLGLAAAGNAVELVEEADLLDENGHRARAFALTVLAAEELGKAFICTLTASHAHGDMSDWQPFAAMVAGPSRHNTKLLAALFLMQRLLELEGLPVDQLAHELDDLVAGDLDNAKMRALYVDIESGAIATPAMVADHKGAQQRAQSLRREIVGWAVAMGGGSSQDDDTEHSP